MSGNSLSSFVVGIGYEMDRQSERAIGASFDRIKKGATVLAGVLAGMTASTLAIAANDDKLSRWGDMWGMSANAASAWGRVFSHSGSDFGAFSGIVEAMRSNKAGLKAGDAGWVEGWGANQLPPGISMQSDPQAMIVALANWWKTASDDQRINASKLLPIDAGASSVLSQGGRSLLGQLAEEMGRMQITNQDVENARLLNSQFQNMSTAIHNLTRVMSRLFAGPLGEFFEGSTTAIEKTTDAIETGVGTTRMFMDVLKGEAKELFDNLLNKDSSVKDTDQGSNVRQPIIMQLNGTKVGEIMIEGMEIGNTGQMPIELPA